jgi:2-polyprenyl-3-methyl-5-hydroxy-6-metoxy-1,4-benzoquinol methylase
MRYNYNVNIDLSDTNTSWSHMIRLVGSNKRVLDVGCATGHMTKYLASNGCSVVGIEMEKDFAQQAAPYCEQIIVGDIQTKATREQIKGTFDTIIFGDVLEHLASPEQVLLDIKSHLDKDGIVVISLPNIALWRIRIALLFGKFKYSDRGVLDRTHLRFFTLQSAKELLHQTGYIILSQNYHFDFPFYHRKAVRWTIYLGDFIPFLLKRFFPAMFAVQFIFSARPIDTHETDSQ